MQPDTALSSELDRGQVIGLPVNVGTMATVAQEIMRLARDGAGGYVCVANVHMLVEARRDAALREVMESAALVVSDGMPWSGGCVGAVSKGLNRFAVPI